MWADQELVLFNIWYWNFKAAMQWIDKGQLFKKLKKKEPTILTRFWMSDYSWHTSILVLHQSGVFWGFLFTFKQKFYLDFLHYN